MFVGLMLVLSACSVPTVEAPRISESVAPSKNAEVPPAPALGQRPLYPDPITGFYESLVFQDMIPSTFAFPIYLEAISWREEAEHIYAELRENASPALENLWKVDLNALEETFFNFVSAEADVEAYLNYTDAFGDEAGNYGALINRGTGFNTGEEWARASLIEWHVKDWFETFSQPNFEPTVRFYQFEPEEALANLDSIGVAYTLEPYTVDPQWPDQLEEENCPIDSWIQENLYLSGITADMSNDAILKTEIWQAELVYTYDQLLARATPYAEGPREALAEARDALLSFAPDFGICVALYEYSEAFTPELWQEHPDTLYPGSLSGPASEAYPGTCYRGMTLRLRALLMERLGETLPWNFDPANYAGRSALAQANALD